MSKNSVQRFSAAVETLARRGPEAIEIASQDNGLVGHCRLALRDAEGGRQPWKMSDGRWLAFVGEIYNCHSLRNLLAVHGAICQTNSDTEVVARAIEYWGENAYEKFDGMFAVTILDPGNECLELARDRHGLKPVYFHRSADGAAASSESRAILSLSSDHAADVTGTLHLLRTSQLSCNGNTLWAGISLLPPAHRALITQNSVSSKAFCSINRADMSDVGSASPQSKVRYLLEEAVHLQQQADFPVGVFLSGGLDSSLIAALLARQANASLETFSVALEGDTEELDAARQISHYLRARHTELVVTTRQFFQAMRELISLRGVPVVLPNEVLIHLLAKKASESVKAVLSGEGADELFGGYHKLAARLDSAGHETTAVVDAYRTATAWFTHDDLLTALRDTQSLHIYEETARDALLTLVSPQMSRAGMLRTLLQQDHLPHLLLRLDGASMAASLEARAPFTDNSLSEFVQSLDDSLFQTRFGLDKPLLRDAAAGILPDRLMKRPKRAFNASLPRLLDSDLGKSELHSAMKQPLIQKLFIEENLNQLLTLESRTPIRHKNWLICSLGMWADVHRVTQTN